MKVPGIEEVAAHIHSRLRTAYGYSRNWESAPPHIRQMVTDGVLAVFETHVKGMLAEAFAAGDRKIPGYGERPEGYAERIIAQLKEPRHD